ncbi:MAG: SprB repeat-containing protein [Bacteroidetes bacterium]|nr:SprB repeat-containing protein [Bacteroidota bacterium]
MKTKNITILVLLSLISSMVFCQQNLSWAKALKGNSKGTCITSDQNGNVYTAGGFSGVVDFDPGPGVVNVTSIGSSDIFITKFDPSGNLLWARNMGGGSSASSATSIKFDVNNNIILTGLFSQSVDFDPGAGVFNLSSNGTQDIFVMKLNASGNFIWAVACGGLYLDSPSSCESDIGGNIYLTGTFESTVDFNPGVGVYNLTPNGQKDIFILKLNTSGNFVWAKNIGGAYDDGGESIHMDALGNLWSTGYFGNVVDFDPGPGVYNLVNNPNYGTYILELDAAGNFILACALTTANGTINGLSIKSDSQGNIYSTGFFNGSVDFDPNSGVYNLNSLGSNDAYVLKLDPVGNFVWAKLLGGTAIDVGYSLAIDSISNLYITGSFQGTADFNPGAGTYTLASNGNNDSFITKLDVNGNLLCAGAFGGTLNESGTAVHIAAGGNILNIGAYQSTTDFDPGPGVLTLTPSGTNEAYISKFTQFLNGAPISNTLCEGSTVILTGQGVNTYSWMPGAGLSATTGVTVAASPTATTIYTVIGQSGCITTRTLITLNLLPKPNLLPPASPQNLICVPDSVLLQSTSFTANTLLQWRFSTSNTYTAQPFYTKTPGNYFSKVSSVSNGCADSSLVILLNHKIPPNAKLTSHVYSGPLVPVDTVTCYQPTVTLIGASDTSGVTIKWKSVSNNSVYPNPANISTLNNFKLIVTRIDNYCSDSSMIVLVNQNTTPPSVAIGSSNAQLNCSIYTVNLNAAFSPTNTAAFWVSPSNFTIANNGIASSPGTYTIFVTSSDNGCTKQDSLKILQTNQLLLNASSDTTVCKNSLANLSSSAIGTVTGITFNWNTGQNASNINVSPSVTSNYIVTGSSSSGCLGTDTIKVTVPPDIQDSVIAFRSCNNNSTGTILVFAKGGIAPYKYSINNGGTFFANNSFTNIPFGNYNIIIKDSLGCITQTNVTLSATSDLPAPKFLASTLNYKSDTLVLVDISIPKADSVSWVLPPPAVIVGGDMFNPVIMYNDTGTFTITMKAHYGPCTINTTKQIKFFASDTLQANNHNNNGIKSLIVYPNPNDGQFTAAIEFYKRQNMCVQVWNSNALKIQQQNFYDVENLLIPFSLTQLQNGNYFLRLIGEYDSKNFYFILNK